MLLRPPEIKKVIDKAKKRQQPIDGYIPSAVLMLFFERQEQSHLVYIRRAHGMNIHSGHMAFPGGKIDRGDESSLMTAIRETHEEVGVRQQQFDYLGSLGFFETIISKHDAAAHLAWSPSQPVYRVNHREVAEVVEIPLKVLFEQFRVDLDMGDFEEMKYLNFKYSTPGSNRVFNLWGLTARITHYFLAGVYNLRDSAREKAS